MSNPFERKVRALLDADESEVGQLYSTENDPTSVGWSASVSRATHDVTGERGAVPARAIHRSARLFGFEGATFLVSPAVVPRVSRLNRNSALRRGRFGCGCGTLSQHPDRVRAIRTSAGLLPLRRWSREVFVNVGSRLEAALQGTIHAGQQLQVLAGQKEPRHSGEPFRRQRVKPAHYAARRKTHGPFPAIDAREERFLGHGWCVFADLVDHAAFDLLIAQSEQFLRVILRGIGVDQALAFRR